MSDILKALGLTAEQLQERVIDTAVDQLFSNQWDGESLAREVQKRVEGLALSAINEIAEIHVKPVINDLVKNAVIQQTNSWGEKVGSPVTLTEMMVKKAQDYMLEDVDQYGFSQQECRAKNQSFYSTKQTRITHAINSHMQYEISTAMKKILSEANGVLADGLVKTTKSVLSEMVSKISVAVKV